MKKCAVAFAAAATIAAGPAAGRDLGLVIEPLVGHPIYHASEGEAGVVMAIAIAPGQAPDAADLKGLCEELRVAAGLGIQKGADLPLEVVFVVPYKGMAVEGYYLPADGASGSEALVRGRSVPRESLDGIIARAGIPSRILYETDVEHEISCEITRPAWLIRWEDLRLVLDGEEPDMVIEQAHRRFMTIHRSIVEHASAAPASAAVRRLSSND